MEIVSQGDISPREKKSTSPAALSFIASLQNQSEHWKQIQTERLQN